MPKPYPPNPRTVSPPPGWAIETMQGCKMCGAEQAQMCTQAGEHTWEAMLTQLAHFLLCSLSLTKL